ncbi:hypothetical protein Tco_1542951, partial [Tanacetum coccineum]
VAEDVDSKEIDEEPPVRRRPTGVVIGREVRNESDDEGLDHSKKLKGLETLSEVAQFQLNIKKALKASKDDFYIQHRLQRGSGEGSGVTLEVLDELTHKSSNEVAGVISEVPDEPNDYSSSSSSDLEFTVEDISSDEAEVTEKDDEVKKVEAEKDIDEHSEPLIEKPEATLISSYQTLSSAEFTNQFLNETAEGTLTNVLKDMIEPEVQSMVDIPFNHPNHQQHNQRGVKRILLKSKKPESQVDSGELKSRVTKLEKKVHAMSSFNLPEAIDKSVKAHLMNVLPKDVPDFGKIKMEKAAKKSMPKHSSIPFDQAALDEFEEKDKLFQMMSKSRSYNKHPTHKALYDALALSLSVDEDDMEKQIIQQPSYKKRR